jgi:membrane protein
LDTAPANEPAESEPSESEPGESEPGETEPGETEQDENGPAESEAGVAPRPVGSRPVGSRPISFWHRWWDVLYGAVADCITDRMSLAAAGCAFYATLALFPAISTLVSIYGLAFNPAAVEAQLSVLRHIVPAPAFGLISSRVQQLVSAPSGKLTVGLGVSFLLTFWSASTGTRSVLSALNVAHDQTEQRGYFKFQLIGLAMTMAVVLVTIVSIVLLVFIPAVLSFIGLSRYSGGLLQVAAMALLIFLFGASLAVLYRLGPSRRPPPDEPVIPGVLLAIVLWLAASLLLNWYVANIGSFGVTYGPIGAVVGIMLWFYVSAYASLLGAELNVRLQQHPSCASHEPP